MQTVIQQALMYAVDQDVGGPKNVGSILNSTKKKNHFRDNAEFIENLIYLADSKGHNYHRARNFQTLFINIFSLVLLIKKVKG